MPEPDAFETAVKQGDLGKITAALANQPSLTSHRDASGSSMIQLAAYYGRSQAAQTLADAWPDMDLASAICAGRTATVAAALAHDPSQADHLSGDGFLPLCLAAAFGHRAILDQLLAAGARVNAASRALGGVHPLDSAVFGGDLDIVRRLLESGADPNLAQEGGFMPLHGAAQRGDSEMVELLLSHGADPIATSDNGKYASDYAMEAGHVELADRLTIVV